MMNQGSFRTTICHLKSGRPESTLWPAPVLNNNTSADFIHVAAISKAGFTLEISNPSETENLCKYLYYHPN
jgi:hypothetical protein